MPSKNGHAARKKAEAKRAIGHATAATQHNELHAQFFGVPNIPLREIRDRLDPLLTTQAIREITKLDTGDDDAQG